MDVRDIAEKIPALLRSLPVPVTRAASSAPRFARLTERPIEANGRRQILLERGKTIPRLTLPRAVGLRHVISSGRFKLGDMKVRDPLRVAVVKMESNRINGLRDAATRRAKQAPAHDQ